ncbi:MAG: hypothetical protein WC758_07690 [Candidatus Woesearchaeota archaeon]|jgi:hypothetical protein
MKRITIEIDDNLNSRVKTELENMQPVHYSIAISELETAKLMMLAQRNKMIEIKHE